MELVTISELTRAFQVSARTLRYYDAIGLLPSTRREGYAYRVYDEAAVRRLQQIITLRKLRIPLKKIALIFDDAEQTRIVEVFQQSLEELDEEIGALQTIRDIVQMFIVRLNAAAKTSVKLDWLDDAGIMEVIQTLSLSKIPLKEERSMEELSKASDILSTLKNVRIIYLPPCTVAASHYVGENPEDNARKSLEEFVQKVGLEKIKPDLRMFGFNNPSPTDGGTYGYELWVTIPDELSVPVPLEKKRFAGGLYAAHCIRLGDFHEWQRLGEWLQSNGEYEQDIRPPEGMNGELEETLNAYSYFAGGMMGPPMQLDLLAPVRVKKPKE